MIDFVKDHLVLIISKMKTAKEMFDVLKGLYEINNPSRALALRQQLHHVKMARGELVISLFMKIFDLRDQLSTIGDIVADRDLVILALNGLPQSWEPFIQSISGRSKLPKFDHLRADCIQEETRLATRGDGRNSHNEESQVLVAHAIRERGKGRKGKRGTFKRNRDRKADSVPELKKKDLSHIQCYRCDKYGHYA